MALTGIEVYKFLPKTNCKKCSFPTCLAFAMKVASQVVDISGCPDISEESKAALESKGRPPIRLVSIGTDDNRVEVGNETVMFRHEKTFYHPPGLMIRIKDTASIDEVEKLVDAVASYTVERVGTELKLDGFAVQNESGDADKFIQCVEAVMAKSNLPLVLMSEDSAAMEQALSKATAGKPLIHAATKDNWESMVNLAKKYGCPLAVREVTGLSELADLSEKVTQAGVEDIVLDAGISDMKSSVDVLTQIRRLALKQNFRPVGYPVITFPGEEATTGEEEAMIAAQHIAKYGSIIVLDRFTPSIAYPLLTLRLNIYTDPQKPIQMAAGMYEVGSPKPDSPLCVTTNFSLTYFSVAGEIEASGFPSWLLICDSDGLSVLTAWAAGKFDSERIAKAVKEFDVAGKLSHKSIILPGKVAVLRGELEEELPDWKILIGPPEAMDIGSYLKKTWQT